MRDVSQLGGAAGHRSTSTEPDLQMPLSRNYILYNRATAYNHVATLCVCKDLEGRLLNPQRLL